MTCLLMPKCHELKLEHLRVAAVNWDNILYNKMKESAHINFYQVTEAVNLALHMIHPVKLKEATRK